MFALKPKEDKFFELFTESTRLAHKGAVILKEVMDDPTLIQAKMDEISDLEHEADEINDAIIDTLNQTFITPLDREDIFALATKLDDIVDFLDGTMERMLLYRAGAPTPGAIELARLLVDCTAELEKTFTMLKNIRGNQQKILDRTRKIVVLESEGDRIYRKEVATLFTTCSDPIHIIKWKEILEHLEDGLDHCEHIADLVRGIVMKYA